MIVVHRYYFGGIPLWLRNVDNVSCFRCSDPVWERESARFVGEVVQQLMAAELLYDQGGPVIMLQIENEYNGGDSDYLSWTVAMAQNLTKSISKVPWNLCHDQSKCAAVNAAKGPDQPAVLCTINGFWMDDWTFNPAQPSPIWVSDQNNLNKGQPFMWTEDQVRVPVFLYCGCNPCVSPVRASNDNSVLHGINMDSCFPLYFSCLIALFFFLFFFFLHRGGLISGESPNV